MSWHLKYWDTIDQLYWSPHLLGLESIPRGEVTVTDTAVSVPRSRVQKGGSIYARKGTAKQNLDRMRRLEEPLNHIFDITFAIAPNQVVRDLLFKPLGFCGKGNVDRIGREVSTRYSEFTGRNVTQQDAFFVADDALVGVELKVGSKTWPGQVLKYLALMVCEERLTGQRSQLGLLYITPETDGTSAFKAAGCAADGRLPANFIETASKSRVNAVIRHLLLAHPDLFASAVQRIKIGHISWSGVHSSALSVLNAEGAESAASETLKRLMQGFADAIEQHEGVKI